MNLLNYTVVLLLIGTLAACGGDKVVDRSCDEPKRYQSIGAGKKLEVPEGLNPLNEFAEMPIPSAQGAPERPEGAPCIEKPPSIGSGSN